MTGPATFSLSSDLSCRGSGEDGCSYFHFGPPKLGTADQRGSAIGSVRAPGCEPTTLEFREAVVSTIRLPVELWTQSHSGSGP